MAGSTTKELLSRLKTSMPKVENSPEPPRTLHQFPEPATVPRVQANVQAKVQATGQPTTRAPKLSVSLYARDIERLEQIKDFMKAQGFRNLSDSEALRLACRQVKIDTSLVEIYRTMQGEDGRRTLTPQSSKLGKQHSSKVAN